MKVLRTFEKCLAFLYIRPELEPNRRFPKPIFKILNIVRKVINPRTLHIHVLTINICVSFVLFLYLEARTFQEYSETIYATSILASVNAGIKLFEFGQTKIFRLIDNFGDAIRKRE